MQAAANSSTACIVIASSRVARPLPQRTRPAVWVFRGRGSGYDPSLHANVWSRSQHYTRDEKV